MRLLSVSILVFVISIYLLSYKKNLSKKNICFFYISLITINLLLEYIIKDKIKFINFFIIEIFFNCLMIKVIFRKEINILDIFYLYFIFLLYRISNIIIKEKKIIIILFLIISYSLLKNKNELMKFNYKLCELWNRGDDNSLRLRCFLVIVLNLSIFLLNKLYICRR